MRGYGSILLGLLGLAVLEGIVSRSSAANNVGGLLAGAGAAVEWFISPTVPGLKGSQTSTTTTAATTPTTPTTPTANASPATTSAGVPVLI